MFVVPVHNLKSMMLEHHFPPEPVSDLHNCSDLFGVACTVQDPYTQNICMTKLDCFAVEVSSMLHL